MKKAVAYIRTSDEEAHIDGPGSHDFQRDRIKDYADRTGYEIVRSYYEPNTTHEEPPLERLHFSAMLFYAVNNNIDAVIVESGGRISRNCLNLVILSRDFLYKNDVNIIATDMPCLFTNSDENPSDEMISNVLFSIIEYQENSGQNIRHWSENRFKDTTKPPASET